MYQDDFIVAEEVVKKLNNEKFSLKPIEISFSCRSFYRDKVLR